VLRALRPPLLLSALLLAACQGGSPAPEAPVAPPAAEAGPLRMMSFNLRYGTAADGEDRWELRRGFALDVVAGFGPEVLAAQEVLDFQMDELAARFPQLRPLGQHREGGRRGEFSGLLVDERRLEVRDWGELWLSPTPERVGSRGWDAALPRMAVWALLADRAAPGSGPFLVCGTHFDHRGAEARLRSAELIGARMAALSAEHRAPVVVMGDLNAGEDSPPLAALRAAGLRDSFRDLHPEATEVGTFSAFRGVTDGAKIDHLLVGEGWRVLAADILRPRRDGRCPSDHEPVVAVLARG
jgi:endonuclease/exonuclease/phosphatase family metal-dependent hydrolase